MLLRGQFALNEFAIAADKLLAGARGAILSGGDELFGDAFGGLGGAVSSILGGISGALGSVFGGGGATPLASAAAATGIISPFHHGRRFAANQPILVGEAGPELLVPPMAGEIVPNRALDALAPQQPVNQKFVINISPGVPEAVRSAILRLKPQIQQWAVEGVLAAGRRGGAFARMPRI